MARRSYSVVCIAVVLLLAAVSHISGQNLANYGQCETPHGENGLCILLEECTSLFNLLKQTPLPDEDRQFLGRSQCGTISGKVLICCALRRIEGESPQRNNGTPMKGTLPEPGVCGDMLSNHILGGNVTKIDEFPWMVLIEYTKGDSSTGHHCGGSLINQRYVLTAAHCVSGLRKGWTPFRVRLGEWDTSTERDCQVDTRSNEDCSDPHVDITIEKAIPHGRYSAESQNKFYDIALLRLSRTVTYTYYIRPICLPSSERTVYDGIRFDIAGWGNTERGVFSTVKLKAAVTGVPLRDCQRLYNRRRVQLHNAEICAGGEAGVDSCRGDSGGALIGLDTMSKNLRYNYIAGIVSFGPDPCGLNGWPGVYTRVSDYVDWIKENIEP